MKQIFFYRTKIGDIGIAAKDGKICNVLINENVLNEDIIVHEAPIIRKAYTQLCEYLEGNRTEFDLEYLLDSTDFRVSVWKSLQEIPYGKTISYKELAIAVGNPKGARAVGNANGKNPIPIFIPCHRVITNDGKLGGYSLGLDLKEKLLEIEKIKIPV